MGLAPYRVTSGEIRFKGQPIQAMPVEERARHDLGMVFVAECQFEEHGPQLRGVCIDVSTGDRKGKPGKSDRLTKGSVAGQDAR